MTDDVAVLSRSIADAREAADALYLTVEDAVLSRSVADVREAVDDLYLTVEDVWHQKVVATNAADSKESIADEQTVDELYLIAGDDLRSASRK